MWGKVDMVVQTDMVADEIIVEVLEVKVEVILEVRIEGEMVEEIVKGDQVGKEIQDLEVQGIVLVVVIRDLEVNLEIIREVDMVIRVRLGVLEGDN